MRRHPHLPAAIVTVLLLAAASTGCRAPAGAAAAPPPTTGLSSGKGDKRLTQAKLFALVTAFADRYVSRVAEATDRVAMDAPTAVERERAVRFKTAVGGAALMLSASPNPQVAMLDLIVHCTLMRDAVRGDLGRETFGRDRARVAPAFEAAHDEAWGIAHQALSDQQVKDLRQLIAGWRKANPKEQYVFRVRFEDFADARFRTSLAQDGALAAFGGLSPLAPVDNATAEMRQARDLMERIVYISQRMPLLLSWEGEGMGLSILSNPDVQRAIETSADMAKSTDAIARTTADVPKVLASAADPASRVLEEYNRATEQTRMMLGDVQAASASVERLGHQVQDTAKATQLAFDSMKVVFATLNTPHTQPSISETDKYIAAFGGVSAASKDLSQTAKDVKATLESPVVGQTVGQAKQIGTGVVDHASVRAIQVMAVGCAMVLLTWVAMRVLDRKVLKR